MRAVTYVYGKKSTPLSCKRGKRKHRCFNNRKKAACAGSRKAPDLLGHNEKAGIAPQKKDSGPGAPGRESAASSFCSKERGSSTPCEQEKGENLCRKNMRGGEGDR